VDLILQSLDESALKKVELRTQLDDSIAVYIDRDQFTEIVLNLVRNAHEAMPEGGELRVRAEAGKLPAAADAGGPPTHAILTVSDTGCGFSAEVQERLFEPFFTTKRGKARRSRGMGLAVVYAAVKNAGGRIQVSGKPGTGATFQVWLPLADPVEIAAEDDRRDS
jgi:signal transduction histidine kinase